MPLHVFTLRLHMSRCVCVLVFVSVSTAGSVRPPVLPTRCARVFVSKCAHVGVCMQEREIGLSYGLHAVTKESRLWDMPRCQEHPLPTLYRHTAFHCMDTTAKPHLFCFHLPSGDRAKCFLLSLIWQLLPLCSQAWFTSVNCIYFIWLKTWHTDTSN